MTPAHAYIGLTLVLLGATGCGGCPSPESPAKDRKTWIADLARKSELVSDARRTITIKRDVHNFVIAADADVVARKFHEIMRDPTRCFGLIEVDRPDAELGQPFHIGSRFQGRYRIEDTSPIWQSLSKYDAVREAFCAFENNDTSDYGVIAELTLPPDATAPSAASPDAASPYVLEYHYLQGSPISGSSRFEVAQLADHKCRLTQIFTYQENSAAFAAFFANGGLTLHNQVVASQVAQTVQALSTTVDSTDIPADYQLAPRACPKR